MRESEVVILQSCIKDRLKILYWHLVNLVEKLKKMCETFFLTLWKRKTMSDFSDQQIACYSYSRTSILYDLTVLCFVLF